MKLDSQLEHLIFDRIPNDITARNKKGYYNYNDLNRIEIWCRYLEHWINENHYYLKIDTKINWCRNDFPTVSQLERIRNNIQVLKYAYYILNTTPATPVTLNQMTIYKANDIERILYDIDKILIHMCNNFIYCGISKNAQSRLWQKRFRKSKTWTSQPYKLSQYKNTDTLKMIATQNDKTLPSNTKVLKLAQIDKTDDIYASVNEINKSIQIIDDLVGFEYEYYTLINLIRPIEYETFDNGAKSTAHTKYGSNTLMITGIDGDNEEYAISSTTYSLNPTHIYFACVETYSETGNGTIDFFFPPASPSFFGGKTITKGAWKRNSIVSNRNSFTAGEYKYRLDYNNGGIVDRAWFDGAMLIDLTEAFGVGNEPDLTWCNSNIPYFKEMHIIKIIKEKS